ncbi:hypothetical protein [Trichothermofontia sp.]
MQEQILKQVRQAQEYETAIQHWQTRCMAGQQQAKQLEPLLQQLATQLTALAAVQAATVTDTQATIAHLQAQLAQLLVTLTPAVPLSQEGGQWGTAPSSSALAPKPMKVDLPNFLSRRS